MRVAQISGTRSLTVAALMGARKRARQGKAYPTTDGSRGGEI
jgi:hypothetical protein